MKYYKQSPNPSLKVCVIIPVKDEAESIIPCLEALRLQEYADGKAFSSDSYEVLVLTNNCEDNSLDRVREYQCRYPSFPLYVEDIVFPEEEANIGNARCFLMDIALSRFSFIMNEKGIIASTDGDTKVDRLWLSKIVEEIDGGCDVVGGRIITDNVEASFEQYHLQDLRYNNLIACLESVIDPRFYNPWPSHFQCFGASLAVTCEMYRKVGGLPRIPFLEDVAFCRALELKDAKIRKSPQVIVYTSSRTSGRVERGLSQQLAWFKSLNEEKHELEVECAASIVSRLQIKRSLRDVWDRGDAFLLNFIIAEEEVREWLLECNYFGELWVKAEEFLEQKQWFQQWRKESISKVIDDLHHLNGELERFKSDLSIQN